MKDLTPPSTATPPPTLGQHIVTSYASAATDAALPSRKLTSTKTDAVRRISRHGIIHELLLVPIILCLLFYSIILFMT
jgi:hypothetical protein